MQVFKTYFKIIKKNMGRISIYIGVFLALAIVFSVTSQTGTNSDFTQSKTRVVFINDDQNSVLITGFKEYLEKYSVYVPIENNTQKLQDALFFRDTEYIIKIPDGFTQAFMSGKDIKIQKTTVAGSINSVYMDNLINKYFNTIRLYRNNYKEITQSFLVKQAAADLKNETGVQIMKKADEKGTSNGNAIYFFNYLAYAIISIIVLGVTSIMMVFNDQNIKRRNYCSPIKNSSINMQILAGNIVFAAITWVLMMLCNFILFRKEMFTSNGLFFCLNSLVLTIMTLCLAFLAGLFIKSLNAQSGIANVLGLGFSFVSGVFVPQWVLSKQVLTIAKFTPTYWYVKANNAISNITSFNMDNLKPIFECMLIELGFAAALLSVAMVISKRKQMSGV